MALEERLIDGDVLDPDRAFAEEVTQFLSFYGISTVWLETPDNVLSEIERVKPDAVLLDQFAGSFDCLTLIPSIRRIFNGGLLVLTGNQAAVDRIVALESGADDFVAKTLGSRELLARLRAVLRRSGERAPPPEAQVAPASASAPKWQVDMRRRLVRAPDSTPLRLTEAEFSALLMLMRHAGQLVTRDELSMEVLGRPFRPFDRAVDNLISRIRTTLEPYMAGDPVIRPMRGRGYMFTGLDAEESGETGDHGQNDPPQGGVH